MGHNCIDCPGIKNTSKILQHMNGNSELNLLYHISVEKQKN